MFKLNIKSKNQKIVIITALLFVFIFLIVKLVNNSSRINNPEFNEPETFHKLGTEDYPDISNLDKLIKSGAPEEAVLDLKRLFYDYKRYKNSYVIDIESINKEVNMVKSADSKLTSESTFKFKVKSNNDDQFYFCKITQRSGYGFKFMIYSDKDFNNQVYYFSKDDQLGD